MNRECRHKPATALWPHTVEQTSRSAERIAATSKRVGCVVLLLVSVLSETMPWMLLLLMVLWERATVCQRVARKHR